MSMLIGVKCDRCGFETKKECHGWKRISHKFIMGEASTEYVDLCPKCAEKFDRFRAGADVAESSTLMGN